jgi:hypothetical protein
LSRRTSSTTSIAVLAQRTGLDRNAVRLAIADALGDFHWHATRDVSRLSDEDSFELQWAPVEAVLDLADIDKPAGAVEVTLNQLAHDWTEGVETVRRAILWAINGGFVWTSRHVTGLDPDQPFEVRWDWAREMRTND